MPLTQPLVSVLNDVWDLVTYNLAGFDVSDSNSVREFLRSPIDEFFFTVVYAIVVYMMGMSSFKMIDLVPNNILRWMGKGINTFNDSRENAAESLTQTTSVAGTQVFQPMGRSLEDALKPAPPAPR